MTAQNLKNLFLKKTEDNINCWVLKSEIYERCSPEEKEMYNVDYKTTLNRLCPFVMECSFHDVPAFYYSVNVYPFTESYSHIFSSLESAMEYVIKINKKYPRD
jgi:hypothetical protein